MQTKRIGCRSSHMRGPDLPLVFNRVQHNLANAGKLAKAGAAETQEELAQRHADANAPFAAQLVVFADANGVNLVPTDAELGSVSTVRKTVREVLSDGAGRSIDSAVEAVLEPYERKRRGDKPGKAEEDGSSSEDGGGEDAASSDIAEEEGADAPPAAPAAAADDAAPPVVGGASASLRMPGAPET